MNSENIDPGPELTPVGDFERYAILAGYCVFALVLSVTVSTLNLLLACMAIGKEFFRMLAEIPAHENELINQRNAKCHDQSD